ncbi:hypothetical protein BEH_25155 (plasmid) [Priestia filamentosa]|uniref:Uncharacterized protein n=1 Tax=Priestia filamentosa TaxID=1402861 RepID=A0A2S1LZN9_9BACI|nr:hypothetical protein BEH_25155 [Priestia filamentosa]
MPKVLSKGKGRMVTRNHSDGQKYANPNRIIGNNRLIKRYIKSSPYDQSINGNSVCLIITRKKRG